MSGLVLIWWRLLWMGWDIVYEMSWNVEAIYIYQRRSNGAKGRDFTILYMDIRTHLGRHTSTDGQRALWEKEILSSGGRTTLNIELWNLGFGTGIMKRAR